MDQFDAAWKLLAGNHPEAFLRLFAPDLARQVDWRRQYCFPDHELTPPAPDSRSAVRHPDILLLVTLLDGSPACLHIEIQCSRDEDFARRMAIYRSRLNDRFAIPVISMALLADAGLRWRPDSYRDDAAKLHMLRQLFAGNWTVQELSDLGQIIDLMMPTPRKWQKEASMDIYDLYDADKHADKGSFAYAFWELTDRRGRMKGRAEGRLEGRVEGRAEAFCEARNSLAWLVERQLAARYGSLPTSVQSVLAKASQQQLEQLALSLLRVRTLEDALLISGLID